MSNATAPPVEESKRREEETMQQNPTAPPVSSVEPVPMGPPPSYNEAMNSTPYPPMPSASAAPYPTKAPYPTAAPYPVTESSMPLPVTQPYTATYPIDEIVMPATIPVPSQTQPMGFISPTSSSSYQHQQPIVNQPTGAYNDEYVHPKTYVVLQEDRDRRRGTDDDCSCTDWMMCCVCCVESCRCLLLCLECAAACK